MNIRFLFGAVILIIIGVTGSYFVFSDIAKKAEQRVYDEEQKLINQPRVTEGVFAPQFPDEKSDAVTDMASGTEEVTPVAPPPVVVKKPVPTPTPTPTPIPVASAYTKASVSVHNGETSCWSIINGSVYDLTSFVTKHPGGDNNILKICGKDGTAAFSGQHGGDAKPESTLAKYYLGTLTQ